MCTRASRVNACCTLTCGSCTPITPSCVRVRLARGGMGDVGDVGSLSFSHVRRMCTCVRLACEALITEPPLPTIAFSHAYTHAETSGRAVV
jgi:hypothetical protein